MRSCEPALRVQVPAVFLIEGVLDFLEDAAAPFLAEARSCSGFGKPIRLNIACWVLRPSPHLHRFAGRATSITSM